MDDIKQTDAEGRVRPALDLVDRNFYAEAPNQFWVADITYIPTWAGFLYLAVGLRCPSPNASPASGFAGPRTGSGWSMADDLKARLVVDAMNMALTQRRPTSVIHHSDQMG